MVEAMHHAPRAVANLCAGAGAHRLVRSVGPIARALVAAAAALVLLAGHAAAQGIGTCYNGRTIAVPVPAHGVVDLDPYGYSICTLTVSGATIYSRYGGAIISITGNNNNLEAEHHGYGHGHGRFQIKGNDNYIALGIQAGNIDVTGTGNVFNVWDTFATEHLHCTGRYPACGNKWVLQGRGGDWIWGADPNRGVQGLPNRDVFDLVMPLQAVGCGAGCDPATVSSYATSGRGNRRYDIAALKGANGPVAYFFDCSASSDSLASFLANHAILPGPVGETWPAVEPAGPVPPWPGGLVPNDIHVVLYGPLSFTAGADKSNAEWLGAAPVIFDPWAYANDATVTVTMSLARGSFGGRAGRTGTISKTGKQQAVNEWIVSQRYTPPAFGSGDSMTLMVTNAGGGAAGSTFPITIAQGGVCP